MAPPILESDTGSKEHVLCDMFCSTCSVCEKVVVDILMINHITLAKDLLAQLGG